MNELDVKDTIDRELKEMKLNDELRRKIRKGVTHRKHDRIMKGAVASFAVIVLAGTTVLAGHYIWNRVQVNDEILPELDTMQMIQVDEIEAIPDENGMVNKDYDDYAEIKNDLGIDLLDTDLSQNNPYMLGHVMTDTRDFAIVTVDNFIVGDTSNYEYLKEANRYSYDHGEVYFSSVSLTIDIILSENQMNHGWDTEYLGLYQFVENYTSAQGYKVNIIEDATEGENPENYVSEKVAVFVADGIRYSLKGRTSLEEIKAIVDTMR